MDRYQQGMIPISQHRKTISEMRERWEEELIFQKYLWEEVQKELKEMKKFKSMQKEKDQLYILSQELMRSRAPSPSYPIFLYEQFTWFQLKELKEGRPYEVASSDQFLETFMKSSFNEKNILCEIYLHEISCTFDWYSNLDPHLGDVQLRAFASFVNNHVQWEDSFQSSSHNEA